MKIFTLSQNWRFVFERNLKVFLRNWKTNLIPPLIEPCVYLLVLGIGVGQYVKQIEGISYLVFVSAGIMASESLLRATFECTYGTFYRMKIQNTFEAVISTPVSAPEVAFGEILWGAFKSFMNCFVLLVILFWIGVPALSSALPVILIVTLGGVNFAALSVLVASKVPDFEHFNIFFALMFPLTFVCGTYFPLSRLPETLQTALWVFPLTAVADLTRTLFTSSHDPYFFLKLFYLFLSTLLLIEISIRSFEKRLVR